MFLSLANCYEENGYTLLVTVGKWLFLSYAGVIFGADNIFYIHCWMFIYFLASWNEAYSIGGLRCLCGCL